MWSQNKPTSKTSRLNNNSRASLAVQRLRHCFPLQGAGVLPYVGELRSQMSWGAIKKQEKKKVKNPLSQRQSLVTLVNLHEIGKLAEKRRLLSAPCDVRLAASARAGTLLLRQGNMLQAGSISWAGAPGTGLSTWLLTA